MIAELKTQRLPSQADWDEAGKRASSIFGVVAPPLLNAVNTAKLAAEVKTRCAAIQDARRTVGAAFERRRSTSCLWDSDLARIKTARATKALTGRAMCRGGSPCG